MTLTADNLERHVGEEFVFARPDPAGGAARLRLIELRRLGRHPGTSREPFSMIFAMMDQAPLGRGLHRLMHSEFEEFDMFLQRVTVPHLEANDPACMYYEAVFN